MRSANNRLKRLEGFLGGLEAFKKEYVCKKKEAKHSQAKKDEMVAMPHIIGPSPPDIDISGSGSPHKNILPAFMHTGRYFARRGNKTGYPSIGSAYDRDPVLYSPEDRSLEMLRWCRRIPEPRVVSDIHKEIGAVIHGFP